MVRGGAFARKVHDCSVQGGGKWPLQGGRTVIGVGKNTVFVESACSKAGLGIPFVTMTPENRIVRCNLVKVRRTVWPAGGR